MSSFNCDGGNGPFKSHNTTFGLLHFFKFHTLCMGTGGGLAFRTNIAKKRNYESV